MKIKAYTVERIEGDKVIIEDLKLTAAEAVIAAEELKDRTGKTHGVVALEIER